MADKRRRDKNEEVLSWMPRREGNFYLSIDGWVYLAHEKWRGCSTCPADNNNFFFDSDKNFHFYFFFLVGKNMLTSLFFLSWRDTPSLEQSLCLLKTAAILYNANGKFPYSNRPTHNQFNQILSYLTRSNLIYFWTDWLEQISALIIGLFSFWHLFKKQINCTIISTFNLLEIYSLVETLTMIAM